MTELDKYLATLSIAERNATLDMLAAEQAETDREIMLAWDDDYGWQEGQDHYEASLYNQ